MAFVVQRRAGAKPSLLSSMPANLFGKFNTNGKASDAEAKPEVAAPKGEKAKPGKRTPTKKEREWLDAITRYGCIACRIDGLGFRSAAVHHILRGGVRMGHLHTLPLCDPGHHQGGKALGKVSRHPDKAKFEKKYGTEAKLLKRLQREVKV
jgi:hypothetical protein